jgi:hypothetical protein
MLLFHLVQYVAWFVFIYISANKWLYLNKLQYANHLCLVLIPWFTLADMDHLGSSSLLRGRGKK